MVVRCIKYIKIIKSFDQPGLKVLNCFMWVCTHVRKTENCLNKGVRVMMFRVTFNNISKQKSRTLYPVHGLSLWCLTSLSAIFHVYHASLLYWWRKPEYPQKTTALPRVTFFFMKTSSWCRPDDNCRSDYSVFCFVLKIRALKI